MWATTSRDGDLKAIDGANWVARDMGGTKGSLSIPGSFVLNALERILAQPLRFPLAQLVEHNL